MKQKTQKTQKTHNTPKMTNYEHKAGECLLKTLIP